MGDMESRHRLLLTEVLHVTDVQQDSEVLVCQRAVVKKLQFVESDVDARFTESLSIGSSMALYGLTARKFAESGAPISKRSEFK